MLGEIWRSMIVYDLWVLLFGESAGFQEKNAASGGIGQQKTSTVVWGWNTGRKGLGKGVTADGCWVGLWKAVIKVVGLSSNGGDSSIRVSFQCSRSLSWSRCSASSGCSGWKYQRQT